MLLRSSFVLGLGALRSGFSLLVVVLAFAVVILIGVRSLGPTTLTAVSMAASVVVLALAAGAALFQLHHIRIANQIVGLLGIWQWQNSLPLVRARLHYAREEGRKELADPGILSRYVRGEYDEDFVLVGNFFNYVGQLVVNRMIEGAHIRGTIALARTHWNTFRPLVYAIRRGGRQDRYLWAEFEFLAALDHPPDYRRTLTRRLGNHFMQSVEEHLNDKGYAAWGR